MHSLAGSGTINNDMTITGNMLSLARYDTVAMGKHITGPMSFPVGFGNVVNPVNSSKSYMVSRMPSIQYGIVIVNSIECQITQIQKTHTLCNVIVFGQNT